METLSSLNPDASEKLSFITTGLQSNDLGIKCEAVAEFSNLVKNYPYPMVISPIFVRLIEAFKIGPNCLRLTVLKSCETCKEHLAKMTCADDIIYSLSHITMSSTDSCARSLCLKLLALLYPIFINDKSVHHMIILSLDSQYEMEIDSAIEASNHYAKESQDFCCSLSHKLSDKLDCLTTTLEMKLQLIRLGQHLHHDEDMLENIWNCLTNLLDSYKTQEFVQTIMDTLTSLSSHSSIHASKLITMIIDKIKYEQRESVLLSYFDNLLQLAHYNPRIWAKSEIILLCQYFWDNKGDSYNYRIIECLSMLISGFPNGFCNLKDQRFTQFYDLLIKCCTSAAMIKCSVSIQIFQLNYFGIKSLSYLAINNANIELAKHTLNTFSAQLGILWAKNEEKSFGYITKSNLIILNMLKKFPELNEMFCEEYLPSLMNEFENMNNLNNVGFSLFCRFITQFCANLSLDSELEFPEVGTLLNLLISKKSKKLSVQQVLSITQLIFQLQSFNGATLLDDSSTDTFIEWLMEYNDNYWLFYRVARQANRYGQHKVAFVIYERILSRVSSLQHIYWLKGLIDISKAEYLLQSNTANKSNDMLEVMMLAQTHFHRGTTAFKCSGGNSLWFSENFVKIRVDFLTALYTLIITLNQYGFKSNPQKMSFTVLMESKILFETNLANIKELIQQCLDADECSLNCLRVLKEMTNMFSQLLTSLVSDYKANVELDLHNINNTPQTFWLKQFQHQLCSKFTKENATKLLTSLVGNALRIGAVFPRYLFQKLQTTNIKLMAQLNGKTITKHDSNLSNLISNISMLNTTTGNLVEVLLRNDQGHFINIFGVVEQKCQLDELVRQVVSVELTITLSNIQTSKLVDKSVTNQITLAQKTVQLNQDYFNNDFLLDFKMCGMGKYLLGVEVCPVDSNGCKWNTRISTNCIVNLDCGANSINSVNTNAINNITLPNVIQQTRIAIPNKKPNLPIQHR